MADALYGIDKNRIDKIFNDMLIEKAVINKESCKLSMIFRNKIYVFISGNTKSYDV